MILVASISRSRQGLAALAAATLALGACKPPSAEIAEAEQSVTAATKVSELSTETRNDGSAPSGFQVVNGRMMFFSVAGRLNAGLGLFRSDGTTAGTELVRDIDPTGFVSQGGPRIVVLGNRGYWTQAGGLWVTDGTAAGTLLVAQVTDPLDIFLTEPVVYGGALFFGANDSLYRSDGTPQGTQVMSPIAAFGGWQEIGGKLVFSCEVGSATGRELCVTDGTGAGTSQIKDILPGFRSSEPLSLGVVGTRMVFSATISTDRFVRGLWSTDGTAAGTVELVAPPPFGFQDAIDRNAEPAVVLGGHAYLPCFTLLTGFELCKTDGTPGGTEILDFVPDEGSLGPFNLAVLGTRLYFTAGTRAQGVELWSSDGTVADTSLVIDLLPGPENGILGSSLIRMGGALYFGGKSRIGDPFELWKTDGTAAGTTRVARPLQPGKPERYLLGLFEPAVLGNQLFFSADDGDTEREPWVTDGTAAGTRLLKDLSPTRSLAEVFESRSYHGAQYLRVDAPSARFLWKTDGTSAGTARLHPGLVTELTPVDHWLYYVADDASGRTAVWKTDGTATGTTRMVEVGVARELQAFGRQLVFAGSTPDLSVGLWQSDGTPAGTALIDPFLVNARRLGVANGRVWLTALDGGLGNELWTTDGTRAGTRPVKDIRPGFESSDPGGFVGLNGRTIFTANDGVSGFELWTTDGSDAGTVRLVDLNPGTAGSSPGDFFAWNGVVLFTATVGGARGLWKTDGTAAGTVLVKPLTPGRDFAFVPWGNFVFFVATDAQGTELWRSDGTPAGTVRAADIHAGPSSSSPALLTLVGTDGPLVFVAEEPLAGRELWKLDQPLGTPELLADIAPGPLSSRPTSIGVQGSSLVVSADGGTGYAVWRIDGVGADGTPPVITCPQDISVMTMSSQGASVTFAPPMATDSSGLAPVVTVDHASGSVFPVGMTRVTATATDAANNAASCSFTVTVIQPMPDAGSPDAPPDAPMPPDAAVPPDAIVSPDAAVPPDAGAQLPDAAARPDAGNGEVPGPSPGGCGCGASPGGGWSGSALGLLVVALLVRRRRR